MNVKAKSIRDRSYLKAVTLLKHIDGNHDGSVFKFVNDHVDPNMRNVKFSTRNGRVWVIAIRDVAPGEEFFIEYGRGHWLYVGSGMFLDVELDKEKRLIATNPLKANEVVVMFSSPAMVDVDGLSKGVQFAAPLPDGSDPPETNCRLAPSPFVNKTVAVTSTRAISKGERVTLRFADRLEIRPSSVPGAGLGAFSRVGLPKDHFLGTYEGKLLSRDSFAEKCSRHPNTKIYAMLAPNQDIANTTETQVKAGETTGLVIDPTDAKGQVRPFGSPPVCFVNAANSIDQANCQFTRTEGQTFFSLFTTKVLQSGDELLAIYPDGLFLEHFLVDEALDE